MPANLLRLTAKGEWGLCEDTLFIISWIETSPLSANLPHNSNNKMDSCFCGASKADANNGRSINQIWAHQCNNLLILFLFPSRVLSFTFPPSHLSSPVVPPPPHPTRFNSVVKRTTEEVGSKGNLHHLDSKSHTILASLRVEWNESINWMQQNSSEL